MEAPNVCTIAVLGAPASGKGTLCQMISSDPRFVPMHHVSVGDVLRGLGPAVPNMAAYNNDRKVLPGDIVVPIIASHVSGLLNHDRAGEGVSVILLDGFPRSLEQEAAAAAAQSLASLSLSAEFPDIVLNFECPKEVLMDRYLKRGRGSDNADLFEKRIGQHQTACQAVVELYKKRGILVEIDTSGDVSSSYDKVVAALKASHLGAIISRSSSNEGVGTVNAD